MIGTALAVGNVISGADSGGVIGQGQDIFNNAIGGIKDIIGGTSEKGSGLTDRNTLAHAIDKLEKANDHEAIEIAERAAQMKAQGSSYEQIANYIGSELGYSSGAVISSHKWSYIKQMLDQVGSGWGGSWGSSGSASSGTDIKKIVTGLGVGALIAKLAGIF